MVGRTRSALLIGASGTTWTPSGKAPTRSVAICRLKRVLPTPPGPVRTSKRTFGRAKSVQTTTTSRSRPINGVSCGNREAERFPRLLVTHRGSPGCSEGGTNAPSCIAAPYRYQESSSPKKCSFQGYPVFPKRDPHRIPLLFFAYYTLVDVRCQAVIILIILYH